MVITSDLQCFSNRIQNFRNESLLSILDRYNINGPGRATTWTGLQRVGPEK